MATDRYSDDHKIIVGGTAGTKEWELQADTIRHSAASDFYITTENAYFSSNSGATFSCNGTKFSYTDESRIDFYQTLIVNSGANIILGDGSDLKMSDTSKIYGSEFDIWAGVDTSSGTLTISANEGHNPKIVLSQSGNSITETAGLWQVSADTIVITGDTVAISQNSVARTFVLSGSSFLFSDEYGSPSETDKTTTPEGDESFQRSLNGSLIWISNRNSTDYCRLFVTAPLPDSIPNGSSITHVGYMIDKTSGDAVRTITCSLVKRSYDSGIATVISTTSADTTAASGYISVEKALTSPEIINKAEYSYTIRIQIYVWFDSGGEEKNYLSGGIIKYNTSKLDTNN